MKCWLQIPFLFLSGQILGQACDTINGEVINCIDKNGRKQGLWKEQRKYLIASSYLGLGSKEGCRYSEEFGYRTLAEGYFHNNQKTGTWRYYNYSGCIAAPEREVIHYPDGSLKEKDLVNNSVLNVGKDSSLISGFVIVKTDTIQIDCKNNACRFSLGSKEEILAFKNDHPYRLRFEIERINLGEYQRNIREIKARRLPRIH